MRKLRCKTENEACGEISRLYFNEEKYEGLIAGLETKVAELEAERDRGEGRVVMPVSITIQTDTSPENLNEARRWLIAPRYRCVVHALDQKLRRLIKHGDQVELQPARDLLHEVVDDEGLADDWMEY